MKTYTLLFHSGKVEVLTGANPKKALEYIVDNHEYIETTYIGELVELADTQEALSTRRLLMKEQQTVKELLETIAWKSEIIGKLNDRLGLQAATIHKLEQDLQNKGAR